MLRRPSAAMLVALLALFVALGGPAQARRLIDGADIKKGTVRSAQIKDGTITVRDIAPAAVHALRVTPDNSIGGDMVFNGAITANKLANGAVTAGKLAPGAVVAGSIADGSVTGAKIADGSLTTADVARFSGRFNIRPPDLLPIAAHTCWRGEPQGLAPERAAADISGDALLVTPLGSTWDDRLTLTARTSGSAQPSRFVLLICNDTASTVDAPASGFTFSYVVFDVP